jgi:short-subunit dehydrogenase
MKGWALVTGSSSGIGRAIARELALRGYPIILHGRNVSALDEVEKDIRSISTVETTILTNDLSDSQQVSKLIEVIEERDIEIIINNAGFGVAGAYSDSPLQDELAMVEVHINTPMKIIKAALPKMKAKKKGYILNVASLYAYFSVPKQSIYGASKAFQHSYSLALNEELKDEGVIVSSLCPGLTYSNFRIRQGKAEKEHIVGMTSDAVAKIAINELFKGRISIVPGFFNKFMSKFIPRLPDRLALMIIHKMNKGRGF